MDAPVFVLSLGHDDLLIMSRTAFLSASVKEKPGSRASASSEMSTKEKHKSKRWNMKVKFMRAKNTDRTSTV